ncbi:MAG TPA: FAD-dependent oxidoreductase, partial [Gemmatimonadales bacterium]|nr:FAD-dependent oxidoreductase [Gemmatimonadales bacterium]
SVEWGETRTGFYTDGRLHSLSSTLEFLRFPPLSLVDKARLAATVLAAARAGDPRALERTPVVEWLTAWSGRRVVERLWLPLLRAKLGENYREASAAFICAIIARMYAARRSGLKREMFGYVRGGYAAVLARLEAQLDRMGVVRRYGCRVLDVRADRHRAVVRTQDGTEAAFDVAVLTVPCGRAAALCPTLNPGELARLRSVVYQGVCCASVLLRRPLAGFYVTNITEEWVPFTGIIEATALVKREQFGGNTLIYLPKYLAQDDPWWNRPDSEIEAEFLGALRRIHPHVEPSDVLTCAVSRAREVLAVPTLGYSDDRLPPVATSLPRVFLVNSAQIAQGTLNVNETVSLADAKAAELAPRLGALGGPRLAA